MKKIMILGAGIVQVPVIKKVRNLQYKTIVVDVNPDAPGMQYGDVALAISTNDYEKVLKAAKDYEIDAILTTSDFPVNNVAAVAAELNLPAMTPETAKICTNKFLQREFFSKNGISHPFYRLINSTDEVKDLTNYPYVIKPISSSGSRGVFMVNNFPELEEKFQETQSYSSDTKLLVEQYIGGREFSVESLTQNNHTSVIAVTEKITRGEEFGAFVEDLHMIPARITAEEEKLIADEVRNLIAKLGVDNCPTHTEVKLYEGKVFVIEIACRLGGDFITSDLVPLHSGIDMLENLVNISVGKPIEINKTINKTACIQFLNSDNYFRCKEFVSTGNSLIVRSEIEEYHNNPVLNSNQRMGYIIMQASRKEEIEEVLTEINQYNTNDNLI